MILKRWMIWNPDISSCVCSYDTSWSPFQNLTGKAPAIQIGSVTFLGFCDSFRRSDISSISCYVALPQNVIRLSAPGSVLAASLAPRCSEVASVLGDSGCGCCCGCCSVSVSIAVSGSCTLGTRESRKETVSKTPASDPSANTEGTASPGRLSGGSQSQQFSKSNPGWWIFIEEEGRVYTHSCWGEESLSAYFRSRSACLKANCWDLPQQVNSSPDWWIFKEEMD